MTKIYPLQQFRLSFLFVQCDCTETIRTTKKQRETTVITVNFDPLFRFFLLFFIHINKITLEKSKIYLNERLEDGSIKLGEIKESKKKSKERLILCCITDNFVWTLILCVYI